MKFYNTRTNSHLYIIMEIKQLNLFDLSLKSLLQIEYDTVEYALPLSLPPAPLLSNFRLMVSSGLTH